LKAGFTLKNPDKNEVWSSPRKGRAAIRVRGRG